MSNKVVMVAVEIFSNHSTKAAMRTFAVDDTSVSGYLYHKLLGSGSLMPCYPLRCFYRVKRVEQVTCYK